MTTPGEVYDELASEQLARPGVSLGRALQNEVLKVNGKIFAFLNRDRLVVKLPRARAVEMIDSGEAVAFESGGRPMKEWVALEAVDRDHWRELITDARGYVGG
jgi:hypothetical protein